MKRFILALAFALAFNLSAYAQEAVFDAVDNTGETVKQLEEISVDTDNVQGSVSQEVKKLSGSFQDETFKKALVNLDEASADIREQLVNYNTQLSSAQERYNAAKNEVKTLKLYIKQTKSKLKNIDKSKKIINKNIEQKIEN